MTNSKKILALNSNSLNAIQIATGIASIIGYFYVDFTYSNILLFVLFFYFYSIVGISMMLHRYYSHNYFEFKYKFVENIFSIFAILAGRGSPLGWAYMHAIHHAHSDTARDPHSPNTIGFRLFGFKYKENPEDLGKVFLVRRLMNKKQQFIHNYYFEIIITILALLCFIDINLAYFMWVLPILLIQCSQNSFNFFSHKFGYRNFKTKDQSKNSGWLWPLTLGDAWHNNHHGNPGTITTKLKWWELDPVMFLINLVKK